MPRSNPRESGGTALPADYVLLLVVNVCPSGALPFATEFTRWSSPSLSPPAVRHCQGEQPDEPPGHGKGELGCATVDGDDLPMRI